MNVQANGFFNEVKSFVNNHKTLCALTLGLAIVGFSLGKLGGRAIVWLHQCFGVTEKTDEMGRQVIKEKNPTSIIPLKQDSPIETSSILDKKSSVEVFDLSKTEKTGDISHQEVERDFESSSPKKASEEIPDLSKEERTLTKMERIYLHVNSEYLKKSFWVKPSLYDGLIHKGIGLKYKDLFYANSV